MFSMWGFGHGDEEEEEYPYNLSKPWDMGGGGGQFGTGPNNPQYGAGGMGARGLGSGFEGHTPSGGWGVPNKPRFGYMPGSGGGGYHWVPEKEEEPHHGFSARGSSKPNWSGGRRSTPIDPLTQWRNGQRLRDAQREERRRVEEDEYNRRLRRYREFGTEFGAGMGPGGNFQPSQWQPDAYNMKNYDPVEIESTKEAVDPMDIIKSQMPGIRNLMQRNFAQAGARMGQAGGTGSAYANSLGRVAAEGSQQMGALYMDKMGQHAEREAAREQERRMAEGQFRQEGQLNDLQRDFGAWNALQGYEGQASNQNNRWAMERANLERDWRMKNMSSLHSLWNMFNA